MKKIIYLFAVCFTFFSCSEDEAVSNNEAVFNNPNNSTPDPNGNTPDASYEIGDSHLGGIIYYIWQPGEQGYVAGETHGYIAATSDQTAGTEIQWTLPDYQNTTVPDIGATDFPDDGATLAGNGEANTDAIIAQTGAAAANTYPAGLCRLYSTPGNNDLGLWYLPAKDELYYMRVNLGPGDAGNIGNFIDGGYWSSTELNNQLAYKRYFDPIYGGGEAPSEKWYTGHVRAVRAF